MSRQPFVDLRAQWEEIKDEALPEIQEVFASGGFIGGERVSRFETDFAALCGTAHCIGVADGTDALYLALRAAGIKPGDEVITVANTFVATVEAIRQCAARPVLVDVRPDNLLMDPGILNLALTRRTRALIPVHLYGQLCEMEALAEWCVRADLVLIEDAAQAHGARRNGRAAGSFGRAAAFSFYPAKNLGAAGDGGAVVTNDAEVARRIRLMRDHGQAERYLHEVEGWNSRLDALQAAVLSVKLKRLARWNDQRRALVALYRQRLEHLPGVELLAPAKEPESHVHHLFVIRSARRDALKEALAAAGIDTGLHYPVPVHLQKACSDLRYREGAFPVTEAAAREILSLPLYPQMTPEAVGRVCDAIEACLKG